jgi:hypothetical protein
LFAAVIDVARLHEIHRSLKSTVTGTSHRFEACTT